MTHKYIIQFLDSLPPDTSASLESIYQGTELLYKIDIIKNSISLLKHGIVLGLYNESETCPQLILTEKANESIQKLCCNNHHCQQRYQQQLEYLCHDYDELIKNFKNRSVSSDV